MDAKRYFLLAASFICADAVAQVPEMARYQELDFTAAEVHDQSAHHYHALLGELRAKNMLDGVLALYKRVQRIADQRGMVRAHRAGWPASAMVSFYQKLDSSAAPSMMSGGHSTAASRISMAKGLTRLFGHL